MSDGSDSERPIDDAKLRAIEELVDRCVDADDPLAELERVAPDDELRERAARVLRRMSSDESALFGRHPDRLGPYVLRRPLGTGGMGTVYLAEQTEPVHRQVALKVVRAGFDSERILARFEVEQQSLALMNHDNIARVFDVGTTDAGQPYFVMEYVEGPTLAGWCDQNRLDVRGRLELVRQVCAGVEHAHQKGILHRDLKPSNVLVNPEGVPKIIDFGLARAIDPADERVDPLHTAPGQLLGTPAYMSPEQAATGGDDVDTRTDIYALGAMLYELLTGRLPFGPGALSTPTLTPVPPSAKVVTEHDATTATQRRTTTLRLSREMRGDLDWIVLRAIAHDREERYPTADALGEDLRRYLDHEPVEAGPPSTAYRVRKFLRRYRVAVATVGVVLLALVAGLVTSLLFYRETARAQRHALEKVEEFNMLANAGRLESARAAEATLYPPSPELVPAIEDWLDDHATPILTARDTIARIVDTIRTRTLPRDPEQIAKDREAHPRAARLRELEEFLDFCREQGADGIVFKGGRDAQIARVQSDIDEILAEIDAHEVWHFAEPNDRFLHDALNELLDEMRTFERDVVAAVRARLAWSKVIVSETVEAHADAWSAARDAIRTADGVTASTRYAVQPLDLEPQLGLIPIGMNPATGLWEFHHAHSAAPGHPLPEHDEQGHVSITPDSGIVFVLVPGGTFWMGCQNEKPDQQNYEPLARRQSTPIHEVQLTPFFIARHEMTKAQWRRLAGPLDNAEPSVYPAGFTSSYVSITAAHPIESINWNEARGLLQRAGLELPTEAQWEYAARAGTETSWWTGAERESLVGAANLADASAARAGARYEAIGQWKELDDGHPLLAPVDALRANGFGLHLVHGNVWEWCRDTFYAYNFDTALGDGARSGDARNLLRRTAKIYRGGSFYYGIEEARCGYRGATHEDFRDGSFGFRAARPVRQR